MGYELNGFYNVDCMDLMKEIPDKYFELAIVDPPYGIGINHNMGRRKGDKPSDYKKVTWDNEPPSKEYFDELLRVSKNQIIWGANRRHRNRRTVVYRRAAFKCWLHSALTIKNIGNADTRVIAS